MSTNFYWRRNLCRCCGRYDVLHVGKSGPSFQGHFDSDDKPIISSWRDWVRVFRSEAGELWDEYGDRLDVEDYIAHVKATTAEDRGRQYRWVADPDHWFGPEAGRYLDRVDRGCSWMDEDGFSFYGGEFE